MSYGSYGVSGAFGRVQLKYIQGATGTGLQALNTQTLIPHAKVMARNPHNKSYFGGVNNTGYISGAARGKLAPNVTIVAIAKPSWCTSALLSTLMIARDSNFNTGLFGIEIYDQVTDRIFDAARLAGFKIRRRFDGGPITVALAFKCLYDNDDSTHYPASGYTPTGFSAPGSADAAQVWDITKVSYGGTLDQVQSLAVDVNIAQGYVGQDDGTYLYEEIKSGGLTGQVVVSQLVKNTASPSDGSPGATINMGITGAGVSMALLTSFDETQRDLGEGFLSVTKMWTLADLAAGGNPIVFSAM
jgi:hypothetical protein